MYLFLFMVTDSAYRFYKYIYYNILIYYWNEAQLYYVDENGIKTLSWMILVIL